MAAERIELLSVTYVLPEGKEPYFQVGFEGGAYVEKTAVDAADRVEEVLSFLARSAEIDRLGRGRKRR
jgi:hypothetical protein